MKRGQEAAEIAKNKGKWGLIAQQQAAEIGKQQQQNKAATTIQTYTRRHLAQKVFETRKKEVAAQNKAATTIQAAWKGHVAREKKEEQERVAQIIRLKKENQLITNQKDTNNVQVPQKLTQKTHKPVVGTTSPKGTIEMPLQSGTITPSPSQQIVWHTGSTQNRVKIDPLLSAITSADLRKMLGDGAHTDKGGSLVISQHIVSELNQLRQSTTDLTMMHKDFKQPISSVISVQKGDKQMAGYKTYVKNLGGFLENVENNFLNNDIGLYTETEEEEQGSLVIVNDTKEFSEENKKKLVTLRKYTSGESLAHCLAYQNFQDGEVVPVLMESGKTTDYKVRTCNTSREGLKPYILIPVEQTNGATIHPTFRTKIFSFSILIKVCNA